MQLKGDTEIYVVSKLPGEPGYAPTMLLQDIVRADPPFSDREYLYFTDREEAIRAADAIKRRSEVMSQINAHLDQLDCDRLADVLRTITKGMQ